MIKPTKTKLERLNKFIIEVIHKEIIHLLNMNQWKNTEDVIDWFKSINERYFCKFIVFDIKDLYPSIKESLLKQSIDSPENYIEVFNEDKVIT